MTDVEVIERDFVIDYILFYFLLLELAISHPYAHCIFDRIKLQALRPVNKSCKHRALATASHSKSRHEFLKAIFWKSLENFIE